MIKRSPDTGLFTMNLVDLYQLSQRPAVEADYTRTASRKDPDLHWDLGLGYDGAVGMLRDGWCDCPYTSKDLPPIPGLALKKRQKIGEEGEEILISEYLSQDDRHWLTDYITNDLTLKRGSIIPVRVSVSASCDVSGAALAARGYKIMSLVKSLESCGYQVDLSVCADSGYSLVSSSNFHIEIVLKGPNDYLNEPRALFCLAHPAFTRRLLFNAREQLYIWQGEIIGKRWGLNDGYGWVLDSPRRNGEICIPASKYGSPHVDSVISSSLSEVLALT